MREGRMSASGSAPVVLAHKRILENGLTSARRAAASPAVWYDKRQNPAFLQGRTYMAICYLPRVNPDDETSFRRILGDDFPIDFGQWSVSRQYVIEARGDECKHILVLPDEFEMFVRNRPHFRNFDGLKEFARRNAVT
jgi:hypothetical protein